MVGGNIIKDFCLDTFLVSVHGLDVDKARNKPNGSASVK